MEWISVSEQMPDCGNVLLTYKNSLGKCRIVVGRYIKKHTEETDDEDFFEEWGEVYYTPEGWYENQDNWGDYAMIFIHEGEVTHWMPLPPPPTEKGE
jgi:hypothetical protein